MNSIIDYLEHWAAVQPDKCLVGFLDEHGNETDSYTNLQIHERTCLLAEYLSQQAGINLGDRALLVYPPGLELIVAFFACARIGAISVPVCPPTPLNFTGGLARLAFVARDCEAKATLTTREIHQIYQSRQREISSHSQIAPELSNAIWITTDDVRGRNSNGFRNNPSPTLFLQYTSGSTSDPKGVIVSHENVIHNCRATIDHTPIGVSWLPQYHDMGLIGYYLYPAIMGGTSFGISPMSFLKRPILWLQALSRFRATYASAPNFGFEYCLREDKVPIDQIGDLDLSSLRVLMNASEPVRAATYSRFFERFAPYGLKRQAHVAAYGLAENTLAVTHYGSRIVTVNKRLLQERELQIENTQPPNKNQLQLVSCGRPLNEIDVRIVDPDSRTTLGIGQIGEIWLAGPSTCRGYWNRPELTQDAFNNTIENEPDDHNGYLRTGDLGFLERGELFVCGRIKDMIIIRGVNYYPQDIELIVESVSKKIRTRGVAAIEGREDQSLVVLVEVRDPKDLPNPAEIVHAIRTQYYVEPTSVIFVPPRTIAKTTSGKIARNITRQQWLASELATIAIHIVNWEREQSRTSSSELRERIRHILEPYHLTGHEHYTLAEIGIDSLSMVTLLVEIEQLLKECGAANLVNQVDGRLLQRLTLSELVSLLDQFENVSNDQSPATLKHFITTLAHERDEFERERMRYDAKLNPINRVIPSESDEPTTNVLLTGPTGFFGPFLLSSLLLQTPNTYYALTRASDQLSGKNRIRESFHRAGVWTPALDEEFEKRIHVVCGDIAQHNLGMRPALWKHLSARIHAVIHNAASVNYVQNYDALRPHNVEGTRELLRFSCIGVAKEFHLISSTIIFGWTSKGTLLEIDNNAEMLDLDFGYAQSKWVAEQLVIAAEQQGLNVRIYRPAFISASSGGVASKNDIIIRLLAFMINHGIAVNSEAQISFLPADVVADAVAAIFRKRRLADRTLHLTADDYYNIADITCLITREFGYSFVYYNISDFIVEMNRRCLKDDPLYPLLDFFNRSQQKVAAMQHKRYSNDGYQRARALSGSYASDPLLRDVMSYLVTYMLREDLIPEAHELHTV